MQQTEHLATESDVNKENDYNAWIDSHDWDAGEQHRWDDDGGH